MTKAESEKLHSLDLIINGDGNGNKGLVRKLDKIEMQYKWILSLLFGIFISVVARTIFATLQYFK